MSLNLQLPVQQNSLRPVITVVGVGGAGGNAVNNMISAQLEGVEFVVANTDAQALESALTDNNIQLGRLITQGLGAGATPEIGQAAAEEAAQEIADCISGSNMVFITAGMGGGTGTGAAPVVARMAREQGMLTVGVVTKPFQFEGSKRMKVAEQGIIELQKYVDTLIVIPNQNLFRIANEKTTFADAFRMADEVLHSGVRGVTDLMVKPGLVNLDFADIRTVMQEMGKAMMGTGEASGDKRAIEAAEAAISNPLLDDVSLKGARAALINITGGPDMTLYEVDEAANRIREEIDGEANIIFGSTFHESMQGSMRVSVVATGIDVKEEQPQLATGGATARNFSKPAHKQAAQNFRTTSVNTATKATATAQSVFSRPTVKQEEQKPSEQRSHGQESRTSAESESVASFDEARQELQAHESYHAAKETHVQTKQEPLFVSPAPQSSRPATRDFSNTPFFNKNNREADNASRNDDDRSYAQQRSAAPQRQAEQGSSFGFLNRIADVGRSLNRAVEQPQQPVQRNISVKEQHYAPVQDKKHDEDALHFDEKNSDDYYDIPTFLRRQND
jgi:cell division protein FtsZ